MAVGKRLTDLERDYLSLLITSGQFSQRELATMFNIQPPSITGHIDRHKVRTARFPERPCPAHHVRVLRAAAPVVNAMPEGLDVPMTSLEQVEKQIRDLQEVIGKWNVDAITAMQYKAVTDALYKAVDLRDKLRNESTKTDAFKRVLVLPALMDTNEWEELAISYQQAMQQANARGEDLSDCPPSSVHEYLAVTKQQQRTIELMSGQLAEFRQRMERHGIRYDDIDMDSYDEGSFPPEAGEVGDLSSNIEESEADISSDEVHPYIRQQMEEHKWRTGEEQAAQAALDNVVTTKPSTPWDVTPEQAARLKNLTMR
ncbi:MAG: hypothetical protein ACRC9Y_09135 [Aeromonas veronii]